MALAAVTGGGVRRVGGVLGLVAALALGAGAGCPRSATEDAGSAESGGRAEFEALRAAGGFTADAYVVWAPIWPTGADEVRILYDTKAPRAGLRGEDPIRWVLQPDGVAAIARTLTPAGDGVWRLQAHASDLAPGWFAFRQGAVREAEDHNCGNPWKLPRVPAAPSWREAASAHFVYRWLPGDPADPSVVLASLEARLARIVQAAGLRLPAARMTILHYPSRATGFTYQAHHGNNYDWSRDLVFSAEAPDDVHELTHLLFYAQVGRHVGLFDEGAAVYFGQELGEGSGWRGKPCDDWARAALGRGALPPLADLVTSEAFYAPPWETVGDVYYPAACSFVRYLVGTYGADRFRAFAGRFDCATQDDRAAVLAAFAAAFGEALPAADGAWRERLRAVGLSPPAP